MARLDDPSAVRDHLALDGRTESSIRAGPTWVAPGSTAKLGELSSLPQGCEEGGSLMARDKAAQGLDLALMKVAAFHAAAGHPVSAIPRTLEPERVALRGRWMAEELREFAEAHTIVDQADAMIDLMYFAIGTLVEMGIRPGPLFAIVHDANMAKLKSGSARLGPDGKVAKPPDWVPPQERISANIVQQASAVDRHHNDESSGSPHSQ